MSGPDRCIKMMFITVYCILMPRTQAILFLKHFHGKQSYVHCDDISSENTHGAEISGTRNGPLFIHYCYPCVLSMINHCHYLESTENYSILQTKHTYISLR